jgi:predicted DNA-binding transcriptional regulator AlpA
MNILKKIDKSIILSILLMPLIIGAGLKTLWRMRKDLTFPNPDMWE